MNRSDSSGSEFAMNAPSATGVVSREVEIVNKKGLHARASARFVQTVERFDATVVVRRGNDTVGGTSIMGLMMLAAGPGTVLTIEATGKDAEAVIEALSALIASGFNEED
jgi:phosphocarrier protein HPr